MMGGKDPHAIELASNLAIMANTCAPLLRITIKNPLHALLQPDPELPDIQAAVTTMRQLRKLTAAIKSANIPVPESSVVDYPAFEENSSALTRLDAALHSLMYAGAFYFNSEPALRSTFDQYLAGDLPGADTAIQGLASMFIIIPQAIRNYHATTGRDDHR